MRSSGGGDRTTWPRWGWVPAVARGAHSPAELPTELAGSRRGRRGAGQGSQPLGATLSLGIALCRVGWLGGAGREVADVAWGGAGPAHPAPSKDTRARRQPGRWGPPGPRPSLGGEVWAVFAPGLCRPQEVRVAQGQGLGPRWVCSREVHPEPLPSLGVLAAQRLEGAPWLVADPVVHSPPAQESPAG